MPVKQNTFSVKASCALCRSCVYIAAAALFVLFSASLSAADVEGGTPPAIKKTASTAPAFAAITAREAADEAVKCGSAASAIDYVMRSIPSAATLADKRAMYAFLGSLQESLSLYTDASRSYSAACAIAAGDAEGMEKKSNEQLVLDAVRCALCSGDHGSAASYLASVSNTTSPDVRATAALYREWAALCAASDEKDTAAPLARLKAYSTDSSMKSVRPQVLFTLWYAGGDNSAALALTRDAPDSIEAAIVQGKARMLPVPFWYFMARRQGVAGKETDAKNGKTPPNETATVTETDDAALDDSAEKATHIRIQLGLFRERANAERLVSALKEKGFDSTIMAETRSSGTTYHIVVIDRPTPQTEAALRTAGFEFYPVF